MNRFLSFLFAFILSVGCSNSSVGSYRYIDNINNVVHLQHSVVVIVNKNENGRLSTPQCTAFYVSPRRLATALHCVQNSTAQMATVAPGIIIQINEDAESEPVIGREVLFVDWEEHRRFIQNFDSNSDPIARHSTVVGVDPENDIALIELKEEEESSRHWLSLATDVNVGEKTYTMGMPSNQIWLLSEGIVSSIRVFPDERRRILFQGLVAPGASGSPVIDNFGHVVGVTIQYVREVPDLGVASSSHDLLQLMEQNIQTVITLPMNNLEEQEDPTTCDSSVSSCSLPDSEE